MHVTAIDQLDLSGNLTEFMISWHGAPAATNLPVTFNQGNHLRSQRNGGGAWLAGTVTLADPNPDPARVCEAVLAVLRRHDALRACFEVPDSPRQSVYAATQVSVRPRMVGRVWHSFLTALLNERCRAGDIPGLFFGLLEGTLICAFDHAHADALTIDLILREVSSLYADPDCDLPETADFATRCEQEAAGSSVLRPRDLARDLAGIQIWRQFFAATDNTLPTFPIGLGGTAVTRTVVTPLLDAEQSDNLLPARTFAYLLAALAGAVADVGGPRRLHTLIPVHTRGPRDSGWHSTAGWMVSNAPVIVAADEPHSAEPWLAHAAELAELPLPEVLAELQPAFVTAGIFMVSYLDYRKLGPALPGAQHISAVTHTDTAQLWFTRSAAGLELRVRYPANPEADAVIISILAGLTARLHADRRWSRSAS